MSAALLSLNAVTVRYGSALALDRADLEIAAGEIVALLGANGAGKSSLLKAAMGLARTGGGTIQMEGERIDGLPAERRAALGLGYAPEGRRVFPGMTVQDNLEVAGRGRRSDRRVRRADAYRLFPQLEQKRDVAAWQLSGGQQQMLAIGRAMMTAPRVLLLDEPSLGLSPILVHDVLARLRDIASAGTGVLLAEQNAAAALAVADRAAVLQTGRIVLTGQSKTIAKDPVLKRAFIGG